MKCFRRRPPDFVIGSEDNPYLHRWWIIPKNRLFNIYLHKFMRSDDDRALHDHPWSWNLSIIIRGSYIEHMPKNKKTFGKDGDFRTVTKIRKAWRPVFRWGTTPHRIELYKRYVFGEPKPSHTFPGLPIQVTGEAHVWTIFITGNNVRDWGFYCRQGWRRWQDFVSLRQGGNGVGRGCE